MSKLKCAFGFHEFKELGRYEFSNFGGDLPVEECIHCKILRDGDHYYGVRITSDKHIGAYVTGGRTNTRPGTITLVWDPMIYYYDLHEKEWFGYNEEQTKSTEYKNADKCHGYTKLIMEEIHGTVVEKLQ